MRVARTLGVCALASLVLAAERSPLVAQATSAIDVAFLTGLRWRSIGPANTGGRVDDFAVARVPGVPDAIYVATASGGVFKSTNQGTSWTPVFDRVDAMMSIGDIAVAPSNPQHRLGRHRRAEQPAELVVGRRRLQVGRRRTHVEGHGLNETRHIGRIAHSSVQSGRSSMSPRSDICGDRTRSAASSRPPTAARRGQKVLFVDEHTGATDLVDRSAES